MAALGFASYVDRDFESILSAARPGDTGEAYAFDETGTLLSEVRDVRGLHDAGTLPQGARRTAFRLKLRDPGRELDGGRASGHDAGRMAAHAAGRLRAGGGRDDRERRARCAASSSIPIGTTAAPR